MSKFGHSPYAYCLICAWWIPKFGHWWPNAQGKTGFCSGQCVQANGRSRTVYIWHNFGTFFTNWVIENFCQNWGKIRKWNLSKEHWMTFYKLLRMNQLSRGARGPQRPTAFSKFLLRESYKWLPALLKSHHVKNKTCENFKLKKTIDLVKWWFAAWKIEQLFIHSSVASNLSNIDGKGHKLH